MGLSKNKEMNLKLNVWKKEGFHFLMKKGWTLKAHWTEAKVDLEFLVKSSKLRMTQISKRIK